MPAPPRRSQHCQGEVRNAPSNSCAATSLHVAPASREAHTCESARTPNPAATASAVPLGSATAATASGWSDSCGHGAGAHDWPASRLRHTWPSCALTASSVSPPTAARLMGSMALTTAWAATYRRSSPAWSATRGRAQIDKHDPAIRKRHRPVTQHVRRNCRFGTQQRCAGEHVSAHASRVCSSGRAPGSSAVLALLEVAERERCADVRGATRLCPGTG